MRKSWMLVAVLLSGCDGTKPEIYQLLIDGFSLPDSCYTSMMQPSTVVTVEQPTPLSVQVWEGPENTAFMQIESGSMSVEMGAAPNVTVGGVFTGKKVDKGWTFSSDNITKQTLGMNVVTTTAHAEMTFERSTTFKGSGTISSSSNCVGSSCPGTNPSCTVPGIVITGTKIAVQYERAP